MPKISVVIPTYNRAVYLDAAIASVLAQCGADFEIIISDNGSLDNTQAIVNKYLVDSRVRYYRNEQNIGMVRNWRKAIYEYATGDWFILLSDDDYLIDPAYLAKASQLIQNNPKLMMVYAEGFLLDESTGRQTLLKLPFEGIVDGVEVFASRGSVKPQDFILCNIVFNRRMTIELNAFANPDNLACDSELFLKLAIMGDVGVINEQVSVYRFHSENLLKKIVKSPVLIYGNLSGLISPYLYAKSRISPEQLRIFVSNAALEKVIANTLLLVACYSWEKFLEWRKETISTVPELSVEIMQTIKYRCQLLFCRLGGCAVPTIYFLLREKFYKLRK